MERPTIILYSQTSCAESARVRAWLQQRGIPYLDRNVSEDRAAAQALVDTGIFATPLLVIGDRSVLGFLPLAIEATLRASDIESQPPR